MNKTNKLPVVQRVEDGDDQQGDLCGQEEGDDHHQHHCRPLRVLLSLVLPEQMEASPPLVVRHWSLPAGPGDAPEPLTQ